MQYFYLSDSHYSHVHHYCGIVHYVRGLALRSYPKESIDSCSRPIDSSNCLVKKLLELNFCCVLYYTVYVDNGGFVVSPDTVWYAQVLLLFSASAMTDFGSPCIITIIFSTIARIFSIFSTFSIFTRIFSIFPTFLSILNLDYSPLFCNILRSEITFRNGTSNAMHVPCVLTKGHKLRPRGSSSSPARNIP